LAEKVGMLPGSIATDSDVVAELLARSFPETENLATALQAVLPIVEGAFSFVLMSSERLFGVRDPHGFRPLCLGRLGPAAAPEGWVLASETPALSVIGAEFVREVAPGEMVVIDEDGPRSIDVPWLRDIEPRLCIFEFAYIARPDSRLYGREVHETRCRMGELLALQAPAEADMVMGVPESGVPAAEGFARASGIPYGQGLVKNRYIGRSFIAPDQQERADAVRRKLNPLRDAITGKRLVVVDDSIVRGTTQRSVIKMLREAGAAEVHLRISSPPWRWPCFYGIDTPSHEELLATDHSVDEMAAVLGADSLAYISIQNLREAIGADGGFCDACFTGDYPTPVPAAATPVVLGRSEPLASAHQAVLPGV
jgi:amidophosphoribosyltransferase